MSIWESLRSLFLDKEPIEILFKDELTEYLSHNIPLYSKLPDALKFRLRNMIGRYVATTYFEGCGDLELTEEMIPAIAE
ncbi:MAG: zinc-dependent peptidase [Verrucomicrobia bacterium]|nr:zinc-dependent peptidase [Verrucomicrobiota bacterium]